ncbi:hypothetical protein [Flavobacterium sp.]|uniref:hypothetical protein n=1 Tax=Flavobacterium sp. TaxID=239 RepID=UPI00374D945A
MKLNKYWFNLKRKIAVIFFKDVMSYNSKIYLSYLNEPTKGLRELYDISKHRLLDELEENLKNGIKDSLLYDSLYNFYAETPLYQFIAMHYEMTNCYLDVIKNYELNNANLVDKENLYILRTLLQISANNAVEAMASWELANEEKQRKTGIKNSISSLINKLPEQTIIRPINIAYSNNLFISNCFSKYPTLINSDLKNLISTLTGTDAISLLSSGLRNVQVSSLIQSHNNSLQINKMFAQEIINSLCILNESIIKDYSQVTTTIPRRKDRQIGRMLSPPTLSTININVSTILGNSIGGYTALYATEQLLDDNHFNTQFPVFIGNLMNNTLAPDTFKAHILLGIHALRNRVLHDYDDTLCFYTDADLFIKTIGLLFVGVNITKDI